MIDLGTLDKILEDFQESTIALAKKGLMGSSMDAAFNECRISLIEIIKADLEENSKLLRAALRLIAEPERQDKYSSKQIARHALGIEPLRP